MPKTLDKRVILAVLAVATLLIIVDAQDSGPTQQLISSLVCLAITGAVGSSLRRIAQKKDRNQLK